MSETKLQLGKSFDWPNPITLADGSATCELAMVAAFDEIEARQLHIVPLVTDLNGQRQGERVEVTLDEDGNGEAVLALPMPEGDEIIVSVGVAYRCDLTDMMEVTLKGDGINPKEQSFTVDARRPVVEPTPAMPSLAQRARLPEGVILDEGAPWTQDEHAPSGDALVGITPMPGDAHADAVSE